MKIYTSILIALASLCLLLSCNQQIETSKENVEAIKVVESFWDLTEQGNLEQAHTLTTKSFKGKTVEVKNQEPDEKWLYDSKLKHTSVEMHEIKGIDKCVVRVKASNKEREIYFAHDLVRNDKGDWKIISTSY